LKAKFRATKMPAYSPADFPADPKGHNSEMIALVFRTILYRALRRHPWAASRMSGIFDTITLARSSPLDLSKMLTSQKNPQILLTGKNQM